MPLKNNHVQLFKQNRKKSYADVFGLYKYFHNKHNKFSVQVSVRITISLFSLFSQQAYIMIRASRLRSITYRRIPFLLDCQKCIGGSSCTFLRGGGTAGTSFKSRAEPKSEFSIDTEMANMNIDWIQTVAPPLGTSRDG